MSEDTRVQYKFMIPERLKQQLEAAAHEHRRSLSAEIVARLEDSFEVERSLPMFNGALDSLESSVQQNREMLEVTRSMLSEVKGLRSVVGFLAESPGVVADEEFKQVLRAIANPTASKD